LATQHQLDRFEYPPCWSGRFTRPEASSLKRRVVLVRISAVIEKSVQGVQRPETRVSQTSRSVITPTECNGRAKSLRSFSRTLCSSTAPIWPYFSTVLRAFFRWTIKTAGGTLISSSVWDKMREIDATVSILSGKQAGTPLRYVTRIRNDDLLGRHVRRLTVTFRKPSAGGSLTSCHRVMKTGDLFPVVASASSGLGGV
jgi:hypothetical protein